MEKDARYIPAFHFDWLTPLYDPLLRWVMREEQFKRRLVQQAQIGSGQRVLDLGCGTGTLTLLVKEMHPEAEVVGLDGDPRVLDIARAKAGRAGMSIAFDQGMAFQMPYPDQSFDRVVSSLVFHHLTTDNKQRTLGEVARVLAPGGALHLVDFGMPRSFWSRLVSPVMERLEDTTDNVTGRLPLMMREAGLYPVEERGHHETLFGSLAFYAARRPAES